MSVNRSRFAVIGLCLAGAIGLVMACSSSSPSGPGQLAVNLVDAPSTTVDQIWVKITKVTAHSTSAGWVTVSDTPVPVDLLTLTNPQNQLPLGLVKLPAGTITQIRLYVSQDQTGQDNYVVQSPGGPQEPLKVPSGYQSGIKIIGPWNVAACNRTSVTLDFDGKKSIEYHEADGTWILRPVIRAKPAGSLSVECEPAETDGGTDGGSASSCDVTSNACDEGYSCSSGTCTPNTPVQTGGSCTTNEECLTTNCTSSICAPGGPGAPCGVNGDCNTNNCQNGTCGGGSPVGTPCTANSDCASGACSQTCQPGGQGAPCTVDTDCQQTPTALSCIQGFCNPGNY